MDENCSIMDKDEGSTPVLGCGDRPPNFRNGRSDYLGTDGKEAVNGFPAKKSRKGRACRFPTNSILRLLPREGRTDFQHSGTSLPCAFERKTGRISNIRATLNRRSDCQFVGAMTEAKSKLNIQAVRTSVLFAPICDESGKPASPGIQTALQWG